MDYLAPTSLHYPASFESRDSASCFVRSAGQDQHRAVKSGLTLYSTLSGSPTAALVSPLGLVFRSSNISGVEFSSYHRIFCVHSNTLSTKTDVAIRHILSRLSSDGWKNLWLFFEQLS